ASGGKTLFFTTNYADWFSPDSGSTWMSVNPSSFMSDVPGGFCCDQVVQYIPSIDRFVWLAQSNTDSNGENEYRLAAASPQGRVSSNGAKWTTWDLKSRNLAGPGDAFDYPEIAFDRTYLFLSFNVTSTGSAMLARVPLSALAGQAAFRVEQALVNGGWWVRPVQNTSGRGLFAWQMAFGKQTTYFWLRIASWDDASITVQLHDVNDQYVVSTDYHAMSPGGNDWLGPLSKWDWHLYGATQTGNTI